MTARKAVWICLVLLMGAALAFAGGKGEQAKAAKAAVDKMPPFEQWQTKKLGVVMAGGLLNEGYAGMWVGVQRWAPVCKFEAPVMTHGEYDMNKVMAAGESMIVRGYDALMFWCLDPAAMVPLFEKSSAAGVPTASLMSAPEVPAKVTCTVAGGDYAMGTIAGNEMVRLLTAKYGKPKGKVLELQGIMAMTDAQDRHKGFTAVVSKHPEIKVIARQCDWDPGKANAATMDVFTKERDVDAVYSMTMSMDPGIVGALKELGKLYPAGDPRHIIFVSQHASASQIQLLKDGTIDSIADSPIFAYIGLALPFLRMAIEGYDPKLKDGDTITADWLKGLGFKLFDETWAPATVVMYPSGPRITAGAFAVTKQNCDDPNIWGNVDFSKIIADAEAEAAKAKQ